MFRNIFEGWHLILLIVVVLLLFGAKRLPDATRSIARSMRIFKSEMKDMRDEDKPTDQPAAPPGPSIPSDQTTQQQSTPGASTSEPDRHQA